METSPREKYFVWKTRLLKRNYLRYCANFRKMVQDLLEKLSRCWLRRHGSFRPTKMIRSSLSFSSIFYLNPSKLALTQAEGLQKLECRNGRGKAICITILVALIVRFVYLRQFLPFLLGVKLLTADGRLTLDACLEIGGVLVLAMMLLNSK